MKYEINLDGRICTNSNNVKFSYKQVEEYCSQLHVIANNMKDIIKSIESKIKVINTSWVSEGANNYTSKLKKLLDNFEEAHKEIESSILYMADCSEGYQVIDKKILGEICLNLNINPGNIYSKIFTWRNTGKINGI